MSEEASGADLLLMEGINHQYGDREVLRSVSLRLAAGECVAVVGHNGCGKSTLLRLAAGREKPSSGEVLFEGAPLDDDNPATRARVATVLDPASYYPDLTVREHLMFVAYAHGLGSGAAKAVDRVLDEHHLSGHASSLPESLSSGQTQLLLLAVAFVRPHDLLLVDEPEQRLDSRVRGELADRLLARKHEGAAILVATHSPQLASHVADRVLVLESGAPVEGRHDGAEAERAI